MSLVYVLISDSRLTWLALWPVGSAGCSSKESSSLQVSSDCCRSLSFWKWTTVFEGCFRRDILEVGSSGRDILRRLLRTVPVCCWPPGDPLSTAPRLPPRPLPKLNPLPSPIRSLRPSPPRPHFSTNYLSTSSNLLPTTLFSSPPLSASQLPHPFPPPALTFASLTFRLRLFFLSREVAGEPEERIGVKMCCYYGDGKKCYMRRDGNFWRMLESWTWGLASP